MGNDDCADPRGSPVTGHPAHGDGLTRRSCLYASDVAPGLLRILVSGHDADVYNLGATEPVSLAQAAAWVAQRCAKTPQLLYKSQPGAVGRSQNLFPDVSHTALSLGLHPAFEVPSAIKRTMLWRAHRQGALRHLRRGV